MASSRRAPFASAVTTKRRRTPAPCGASWTAASGGARTGAADYWDLLRHVTIPLFALSSAGDALNCHPDCAARFALRAAGLVTIDTIRAGDDGGAPPGHMEIVTTARAKSSWARLEEWMRRGGC